MKVFGNGRVLTEKGFVEGITVREENGRISRISGPGAPGTVPGPNGAPTDTEAAPETSRPAKAGEGRAAAQAGAADAGKAARAAGAEFIDLKGAYLVPGLIDLHVMGGSGVYFSGETTAEAVESIFRAHLRYGVTAFLPTLISSPPEKIFKAIAAVREAMRARPENIPGMHLEGPFLNPEKRGAHKADFLRKPDDGLLREILAEGRDVIRIMTIAPERFSSSQIDLLLESGIHIAVGHTMLTCEEAKACFDRGFRLVTHLFNAMQAFGSREPGLVGAVFDHPAATAAIIADGVHVDFTAVRTAQRLLKERLYLVSDCTFIDYPGESFEFEGMTVFNRDGKFVNAEGAISGSSISVYHAVRNCVEQRICSLEEALAKAGSIPASILKMERGPGSISEGAPANLLVLEENLDIREVYLNGETIGLT